VNAGEQFLLGWEALRRSARHLRSFSVWVPGLLVAGVQLAVLGALAWFAHPAFSWFMAPILRRMAGEEALRYPNVFQIMPALYGRAGLVVEALLGAIMAGATVWLFARRFEGRPAAASAGLAVAGRRAAALVLAGLPGTLLIVLVLGVSDRWLVDHGGPRLVRHAIHYGALGIALVVQAFFLYAIAYVVLEGRGVLRAWGGLPAAAQRGFWGALFISCVLYLPHLPANLLGRIVPMIVQRGRPELVTGLVGAEIVVGLLTNLLLAGGVALLFLGAVSDAHAEGA
jgi:hypothetical protein